MLSPLSADFIPPITDEFNAAVDTLASWTAWSGVRSNVFIIESVKSPPAEPTNFLMSAPMLVWDMNSVEAYDSAADFAMSSKLPPFAAVIAADVT